MKRRPAGSAAWAPVILLASLALTAPAWAQGWRLPWGGQARALAAVATGWDNIGGYATSGAGYWELGLRAEAVFARHLFVGAAFNGRLDLLEYDHALGRRIDAGSPGLMLRGTVGLETECFHLSLGPWWQGESRHGDRFRAGWLWPPLRSWYAFGKSWSWAALIGAWRIRFGRAEGSQLGLQVAEGLPFTAEGGQALRFTWGWADRWGGHTAVGAYGTPLEMTAGLTATSTRPWPFIRRHLGRAADRVRIGVTLGSDVRHPLRRNEIGLSLGSTFAVP